MNRLNKLKRLKDEISRLFFEEGLDANEIFNQLRSNQQFSDITQERFQSFYRHLQEESKAEFNIVEQIEENDHETMEHQKQIAECKRRIAEHQQQMKVLEDQLAENRQRNLELEFMNKYCKSQQRLNKFLICDASSINSLDIKTFWQGRFFVAVENRDAAGNVHTIKVQDLFRGTTKLFTIEKFCCIYDIYALKFPYVLLHEFETENSTTYLRLAKLDFENNSLQVVKTFDSINNRCRILVNTSDSSKFLLREENSITGYKLIRGQISKKFTTKSNISFDCSSYFDERICTLRFSRGESSSLIDVKMVIFDLGQKEKEKAKSIYYLDSPPENLVCPNLDNQSNIAWMRDTVFLTVQLPLLEKYGIIFTSPRLLNWKIVEFGMTDLQINHIQSFDNGTLMICAEEYNQDEQRERKIYKLQMRKPDFLRNMAWITILKLLKAANVKNPYKEARKYLPLNPELQPFIFAED